MNFIECQACGTSALANAHHCENCGGADWRSSTPNHQPSSDSAPVASETTTRQKRNR